ncbi:hypothetical protein J4P02_15780 [Pseudomonas sp. NFXW11]|uniref:immunity protein Imm33 domain-containing protein n=1 Tax=Pseudomonas sp. NFXW11 TaxID=2819531 RepID=UPI003CEB9718
MNSVNEMTSDAIEARQRQLCARHDLPFQAPEELVALAQGTLGQSPIYGCRIVLPENGNISWFIHCGEHRQDLDFYQPLHSYHLAELLPQALDYLGLPTHARFIIDREGYEDVWQQDDVQD